jgi:uncharacterized iron-regulated membrane protein
MKSKRIRDVVFIAHRYIGLAIGILAAAIGFTGSLLIIHGWTSQLSTKTATITPTGDRLPIPALIDIAKKANPTLTLESLELSAKASTPTTAWWVDAGDKWISAQLNPYTGAVLSSTNSSDGSYTKFLYDIHISLMGGEWGAYVAGIVGLLATILCITGIILWPGWRKLAAGFKIKWDAKIKRLNFDLHKVAGIIAAVFLAMAMGTGFIWNYGTWMNPIIYAITFSSPTAEVEIASQVIANQPPVAITADLIQTASTALPNGDITSISLPIKPEGTIQVKKNINDLEFSAHIDQFSGKIIKIIDPLKTTKSLGDIVTDSFGPVHFGTFAGEASRILYVFVGLSPTILLATGLIMFSYRRWDRARAKEAIAHSQRIATDE